MSTGSKPRPFSEFAPSAASWRCCSVRRIKPAVESHSAVSCKVCISTSTRHSYEDRKSTGQCHRQSPDLGGREISPLPPPPLSKNFAATPLSMWYSEIHHPLKHSFLPEVGRTWCHCDAICSRRSKTLTMILNLCKVSTGRGMQSLVFAPAFDLDIFRGFR